MVLFSLYYKNFRSSLELEEHKGTLASTSVARGLFILLIKYKTKVCILSCSVVHYWISTPPFEVNNKLSQTSVLFYG